MFRKFISGTYAWMSPTTAARLFLGVGAGGRGQKLLPAVVAAKVERLAIALGVECGAFVHGHAADRVFGHGFRFIHGVASFLVVFVSLRSLRAGCFLSLVRPALGRVYVCSLEKPRYHKKNCRNTCCGKIIGCGVAQIFCMVGMSDVRRHIRHSGNG